MEIIDETITFSKQYLISQEFHESKLFLNRADVSQLCIQSKYRLQSVVCPIFFFSKHLIKISLNKGKVSTEPVLSTAAHKKI